MTMGFLLLGFTFFLETAKNTLDVAESRSGVFVITILKNGSLYGYYFDRYSYCVSNSGDSSGIFMIIFRAVSSLTGTANTLSVYSTICPIPF